METPVKQVGKRLRAARIAAGYRYARAFTKKYNIPESTYSQHESGSRALSVDLLIDYADRLGVNAGWLLTGEGIPYEDQSKEDDRYLVLYENLRGLDPDLKSNLEQRCVIEGAFSTVDVGLLKAVWVRVIPLLSSGKVLLTEDELFDFVIDIYNGIITTSATESDRQRMIELSLVSLQRGLLHKVAEHNK